MLLLLLSNVDACCGDMGASRSVAPEDAHRLLGLVMALVDGDAVTLG